MVTDEFAPGIPAARATQPIPAQSKPAAWEFALHHHVADKAGEHFDMRLGDDAGHAHSWAMRYWPKPGEVRLAVQQPTHTRAYMDFEGEITDGYGKGHVDLARRERAEVLESTPDRVRFNLYPGREVEEYVLRRTRDKSWMLQNITRTRDAGPGAKLPAHKPRYRDVGIDKVDVTNPDTVLQAKLDGAHVIYDFGAEGQSPRVFSYRTSKLSPTRLIHHTPRVADMVGKRTPKGLAGAVLRGELVAQDPSGRSLPAAQTGGMLNAGVWKSRSIQRVQGDIKPFVFDVERWRGRDVSGLPWREKSKLLSRAQELAPWLKTPRTAVSAGDKAKLVADVMRGKEPSTEEGVVEWHQDHAIPAKAKVQRERDVYVRKVFAETGKREGLAGGFEFSLTPTGPIVGRVGTGMSHDLKRDLHDNPDRYVGLKAKILTTPAPESYAPRAPVFAGWHMEQDMAEGTKMASWAKLAFASAMAKLSWDPNRKRFDVNKLHPAARKELIRRTGDRAAGFDYQASMAHKPGDAAAGKALRDRAAAAEARTLAVHQRLAGSSPAGAAVHKSAPPTAGTSAGRRAAPRPVTSNAPTQPHATPLGQSLVRRGESAVAHKPGLGGSIAKRFESMTPKRKAIGGLGAVALGGAALLNMRKKKQEQQQAA